MSRSSRSGSPSSEARGSPGSQSDDGDAGAALETSLVTRSFVVWHPGGIDPTTEGLKSGLRAKNPPAASSFGSSGRYDTSGGESRHEAGRSSTTGQHEAISRPPRLPSGSTMSDPVMRRPDDRLAGGYSVAMAEASVRELRYKSGEVLDRVERGERLTGTRDGRPVAELHPAGRPGLDAATLLRRWAHLPYVDPERLRADTAAVIDSEP
jgi:prevent-host-death family protein